MSYFEKIKIDTSDVQQKFNKLSKALSDPSGVFSKTIGDMQRRAPGKVADAVREVFSMTPTTKAEQQTKELLRTHTIHI